MQLLFRALAGAEPLEQDFLDVLVVIQPRPIPTRSPLDQEALRPVAARLVNPKPAAIEDICVSEEKLVTLFKAVGAEILVVKEEVNFDAFRTIVNENAVIYLHDLLKLTLHYSLNFLTLWLPGPFYSRRLEISNTV